MRMEAGLDTGPTARCVATPIGPQDTAGDLHDRLAALGAPLMVEALAGMADGSLTLTPQPAEGATYARKIDKAETRIDWTRPAAEIDAMVRGLSPAPGAWTTIGGERVKVLLTAVETGDGAPGVALDERLRIACGTGAIRILRAQRPGKGPVTAEAFLNGFAVPAGAVLGSHD
jgi:methionyl-tRNA formyltransferase